MMIRRRLHTGRGERMARPQKTAYHKELMVQHMRSKASRKMQLLKAASTTDAEKDTATPSTDAGERVANTAELLSNILECLDVKTLANTRRVARIFEAHYQEVSILRANNFRSMPSVSAEDTAQEDHSVIVNPFFNTGIKGTPGATMKKILPGVRMQYYPNYASSTIDGLTVKMNADNISSIKSHLHQSWTEFYICRSAAARLIHVDIHYKIARGERTSYQTMYIALKPCTAGALFEIACAQWKSPEENETAPQKQTANQDAWVTDREEILVQLRARGVREEALEAVVGPMYVTTVLVI